MNAKPLALTLVRVTDASAWEIPAPPPAPPKRMAPDANPSFDVATIKPNDSGGGGKGFRINGRTFCTINTSLTDLIVFAYDVHNKQILNGPDWIDKDKYDVSAVPDAEGAQVISSGRRCFKSCWQTASSSYFITTSGNFPCIFILGYEGRAKELTKSDSTTDGFSKPLRPTPGGWTIPIRNAAVSDFTGFALKGAVLDRPVLDLRANTGRYDFTLTWAPLGQSLEEASTAIVK